MPFLVRHSSLGSRSGFERLIPQLSRDGSAPSKKCPPIISSPPITATPWVEPEVSRTQVGLPLFLENSAKKSLPPAPRYTAPLASTTEWPNATLHAFAAQEASWTPRMLSLTRASAGLPFTASQAHAAQIVWPSSTRSWYRGRSLWTRGMFLSTEISALVHSFLPVANSK